MIKWLVGSSKIRSSRTNWSYLSIKASPGPPEFWHCVLMPWSHPIPLQILHLPQRWIWLLKQMWEGDSVAFLCSNCQGERAEHEETEGKGKEPGRSGCPPCQLYWGPLPSWARDGQSSWVGTFPLLLPANCHWDGPVPRWSYWLFNWGSTNSAKLILWIGIPQFPTVPGVLCPLWSASLGSWLWCLSTPVPLGRTDWLTETLGRSWFGSL